MWGNSVSQTLTSHQAQILAAKICLDQARQQKTAQQFDVALALYDQAKVTFKRISDTHKLIIALSEVKGALSQAQTPQTEEDEALRRHVADIYFERAELLEKLGKADKAQASYKKAKKWGHKPIESASSAPAERDALILAQMATPVSLSIQEKGELVDYLFERALFTLGSLKVSNKPSIFLVYAHDNPAHGKAEASTSKYFINHLSKIQVTLHSDQTPLGQPYSDSSEDLKEDGKLEDILTSQLCLLPAQVEKEVKPVNKVVVCCSEVLGSYLAWLHYEKFYQALRKGYLEDREAYGKDGGQSGASAIREVVRKFSQEAEYKAGFHHVLTEMAFLQIRAEELKDQHGIIPVSLTPNGSTQCLKNFITSTTVRMEDIPRFEGQALSPNQSRHWVLFKLIERLLRDSNEARTFLDKFWQGYGDFIARLNAKPMLGRLEFARQLDGIFDSIRTALHSQLFFTVQQHQQQLRVLNANPRSAIKEQYFDALGQDEEFEETLQLYVEPRGKANSHEADTFNLLPKIQDFLNDEEVKVILLMGDSGAGKTSFNRILEKQLWEKKKEHDAIPLFISLASIKNPVHDLIPTALKKRGLSKDQIQILKKEKQKFIFILDGYDEIRQTRNLYQSNSINQPGSWQGQVVISCRSEYLGQGQGYRKWFQPDQYRQGEARSFSEVVIEPFSEEEQNQYLEKYVERNQPIWGAQQFKKALEQPHLKELVSNPFLLRVVLEVLPYLENEGKPRTAIQLRMDLYNQFVRQWFKRNEQRLIARDLTENKRDIFREMCDEGFAEHGIDFVEDLAIHLYVKNAGNPVVEYSSLRDKGNWKKEFFALDDKKQLLREAWPLSRSGNQYRFIHKLLLEYFAARVLFASLDMCMVKDTRHRRGSDVSVYGFGNQPQPSQMPRGVSLTPKHWVGDLGVVRLLTERVQQENTFKKQLLTIIESSKTDAGISQVAANALTILVKAGVQFNGADLKGIRIPGADLSYGLFDYTEFQGADLSKVNGYGAWLRGVNLDGTDLKGLELGEKPTLEMQGSVLACCYSPDGCWFAVAESNCIQLYETENLQKVHTYAEHRNRVSSVAFSGDSNWLVSGSWDNTVRLWSVSDNNRSLVHTYSEHKDWVISVAFSEDSEWLASGSNDKTVKLWNVFNNRSLVHTYVGHEGEVNSVAFSKDSQWLASGSNDKTVKLWNVFNNQSLVHTYVGHEGGVSSVAFSQDGRWLASGSNDRTVKLWNVVFDNRSLVHTYAGHEGEVNSVAFSSDGQWLASGSNDKTAKLWDISNARSLVHTYAAYEDWVTGITFSVDSQWLASGSNDGTVKLWSILGMRSPTHTYAGHGDWVTSLAFSRDGQWLASGSWDKTVKLWNISGEQFLVHTYIGHENGVESVVFSDDGKWLASGSKDKLVKLWSFSDDPSLVHTYVGHKKEVTSVAFSDDGEWLASGSWDKTVRLWLASGDRSLAYIYAGHKGEVSSVAFSKDSQWLASGGIDKTVKLWHVLDDRSLAYTYVGHRGEVTSVAFSSDGRWLASGSSDKAVKLWSLSSRSLERTYIGHKGGVNSVAFSSDSQWLLSGGDDNTVIIWFVYPNDQLAIAARLQGSSGPVYSIVWQSMQDGKAALLSTAGADKAIRLWRVPHDSLQIGAIRLNWTSRQDALIAAGARIKNAYNLSPQNSALLRQRGANEDTDEYNINQPAEFESDDESIINESSSFESEESSEGDEISN